MQLRQFTVSDIGLLKKWVDNADLLFQFAGHSWKFPLDDEELTVYFSFNKDRQAYIMENDASEPVAFGEIIYDENPSPRLGRLLIGEAAERGKGYGAAFVKLLVAESRKQYNPDFVHLFVLENNPAAIQCYRKCGFKMRPDTILHFGDNDQVAVLMTLSLKEN